MKKPVQQRSKQTHARLVASANKLIAQKGFEAVRVEEIVLRAGVAKGTFFAHFKDKDALMDMVIGARISTYLDDIEVQKSPESVAHLVEILMPLLTFMTCERYVFDVILRHSGAAAIAEVGHIAMMFDRHLRVVAQWLSKGPFRTDVSLELLAEGVQAFSIQAMALNFCALHNTTPLSNRLQPYLEAWLTPKT